MEAQFLQAGGNGTPHLARTLVVCRALDALLPPTLTEHPEPQQAEPAIHEDDDDEHSIARHRGVNALHERESARFQEFLGMLHPSAQTFQELKHLRTMAHGPDHDDEE